MRNLRMADKQLLLNILLFYTVISCFGSNVSCLFIRNITAKKTCGSPAEQYFESWQVYLLPMNRIPFLCNASSIADSLPITNAIDGRFSTFWQSTAGVDVAEIVIDMQTMSQKLLFVNNISLTFGSSQRPGQIKYMRSYDGGLSYQPWHYLVSIGSQCRSIFKTRPIPGPFAVDTVVCTTFRRLIPKSANETVFVDLLGGRGSSNNLQNWLNASHIKLVFSGLHRLFDRLSHRWHHYTVREVKISASCFCNGHASSCDKNANTGDYICACENNACGNQCETCCPKFNQKRWRKGRKNPFEVDALSQCEECNCHNHSNICVYNQTIADQKLSIDIHGKYRGGGVCLECLHNTTGINCQVCKDFFYHPKNVSLSSANTCIPCGCNKYGVRNVSIKKYLDCVRSEDVNIGNMEPGECFCKENVHHRSCNTCKPGFFNLTDVNLEGCQSCECFLDGTVNASITCASLTGQCNCKQFSTGRQCSECLDGYYNLTQGNINGCQNCLCNLGASQSSVCDKFSGVCRCHANTIYGEKCQLISPGFYYPSVHFIQDDTLIRTNRIIMSWQGQVNIPSAFHSKNEFRFVYVCNSSEDAIGFVTTFNETQTYTGGYVSLKKQCNNCYVSTSRSFVLYPGLWTVDVVFPSIATEGIVSCNKVIGIPREFYSPTSLRNLTEFKKHCNLISNNMTHKICKDAIYTLTMDYLHEPMQCNCNMMGSVNMSCEKYKGQCYCKLGVTGKHCDKCKPGFYNFTNTGCTPCNCFSGTLICDSVTGQCECPPNTKGKMCDACAPMHWNLTKHAGCEPCICSAVGATSGHCNTTTGQCECKIGVEGQQCSACVDGFTEFSSNGCQSCNCSLIGSLFPTCDKNNGQCLCKKLTTGQFCDQCVAGTFHLSTKNRDGCLECSCMGVTKNCSMANGYFVRRKLSTAQWKVGLLDGTCLNLLLYNETRSYPDMLLLMISAAILNHTEPLFWISNEDFFYGSAVNSYGGAIEFFLEFELLPTQSMQAVTGRIILKNSMNEMIELAYDSLQRNQLSKIKIILQKNLWWSAKLNRTLPRTELLIFLSKPIQVFISASPLLHANFGYTIRFGPVSFTALQENQIIQESVDIEKCNCPKGYEGFSCEVCQNGYFHSSKANESYVGTCIQCRCHNHAKLCDKTSGICFNCANNTTGKQCELCAPGFYGNASVGNVDDCQPCPCKAPSAASSVCHESRNGQVTCLNCSIGYEGAMCEQCSTGFFRSGLHCMPCQCNNNSFVCTKTKGVCYNCANNTTGKHCEVCDDGWYGNATIQNCNECSCHKNGSRSDTCDSSGLCTCLKNVIGNKCTKCAPNTYGLNSISGCTSCECNVHGSLSLQCDSLGQCLCLNDSTGKKCDQCTHGLWGLPLSKCDGCHCNSTGSVNRSCSSLSGQCNCKSGVGQRQCDTCLKQHTNFSRTGCDACPNCTQLLQLKVDKLMFKVVTLRNSSKELSMLSQTSESLQNVTKALKKAEILKVRFNQQMNSLQTKIDKFNTENNSTTNLELQVSHLLANMSAHANTTQVEMNRLNAIKENASHALRQILNLNQSINSVIQTLDASYDQTLVWLVDMPSLINRTTNVAVDAGKLKLSSTEAKGIVDEVHQNVTLNAEMSMHQSSNSSNITTLYQSIATQHNKLNADFRDMKNMETELQRNYTVVLDIIKETENTLSLNDATIMETQTFLNNATRNVEVVNTSLAEVESAIQIINKSLCCGNGTLVEGFHALNQSMANAENDVLGKEVTSSVLQKARIMLATSENLKSVFKDARKHGEKAVLAIKLHHSIFAVINQSKFLTSLTNETLQNILQMISQHNGKNLSAIIYDASVESRFLFANMVSRSEIIGNLAQSISLLNSSMNNASQIWTFTRLLHSEVLNTTDNNNIALDELWFRVRKLTNVTNQTTHIIDELNDTNSIINNITNLEVETIHLNTTATNSTVLFNEAKWKVNFVSDKLKNTSVIINHVDQSMQFIQQFNKTKESLEARLILLRKKLADLKQIANRINVPLHISNRSIHKTIPNVSFSPDSMEIQVEFRTNDINAVLLELKDKNNKHNWARLEILNSRVVVDYSTTYGNFSIVNWEVGASDNHWKRAHFSRLNTSSRLTVTSFADDLTRTYGRFKVYDTPVKNSFQSTTLEVNIGGLHLNSPSTFSGCIGNMKLNGEYISLLPLMGPSTAAHLQVCGGRKREMQFYSPGASFYGSGYIVQDMEKFSLLGDFDIQMEFRSFKKNGTVLAVQDAGKHFPIFIQLSEGHVVTSYARNDSSTSITFRSQSFVANGNWYRLRVNSIHGNISMMLMYESVLIESMTFPIVERATMEGVYVYLGGLNDSSTQSFAGCMRSFNMSNGTHTTSRSFIGRASHGVRHDGCLQKARKGVHFFNDGFSHLHMSISKLSQIQFTFKTLLASGVILSHQSENLLLYITLFHGNVYVQVNNSAVYSTDQTINDGSYHAVTIDFNDTTLHVNIDNGRVTVSSPLLTESFQLNGKVVIGRSKISMTTAVPVMNGFVGDFESFSFNNISVLDDMVRNSSMVSLDEVSVPPTTIPVTNLPTVPPTTLPPPTCAPHASPLVFSSQLDWIGFNGDSLLALHPKDGDSLLSYFHIDLVITIEFRSILANGVLFYASNNNNTHLQYICIELADGKLVYHFDAGNGMVKMTTERVYNTGQWFKVYAIRIMQFGAILVSETQEYHNAINGIGENKMLLSLPLYLGGTPVGVDTSMLHNPSGKSFWGCIRKFELARRDQSFLFKLREHQHVNASRNLRRCYVKVEPQVSFRANGYALIDPAVSTSSSFKLRLKIRTTMYSGILWHLSNGTRDLYLTQQFGKLQLVYKDQSASVALVSWIDRNTRRNISFSLCDGAWKIIDVDRIGSFFRLFVDGIMYVATSPFDVEVHGALYIAGSPKLKSTGFIGCIQEAKLNGTLLDFSRSVSTRNMVVGC